MRGFAQAKIIGALDKYPLQLLPQCTFLHDPYGLQTNIGPLYHVCKGRLLDSTLRYFLVARLITRWRPTVPSSRIPKLQSPALLQISDQQNFFPPGSQIWKIDTSLPVATNIRQTLHIPHPSERSPPIIKIKAIKRSPLRSQLLC